jgi:hypothetical protein
MANVITIEDFGTYVVNMHVEAKYIVIAGTLEVAAGGVIEGVEVRGGTLVVSGGSVIAKDGSPAVLINANAGAQVTVSGGVIRGGDGATMGGAGIALSGRSYGCTLSISNGLISGGNGGSSGGAGLSLIAPVRVANNVSISGGSVLGGGAAKNAGIGVYIMDSINFSMTAGNVSSPGTAAIRIDQTQPDAIFNVTISGGAIIGAGMFASSLTLQVFQNVTGATVSGGQFTGQWLLASGIAFVHGTQLAFANGTLTGTLASGDPINVPLWVQQGAQLVVR